MNSRIAILFMALVIGPVGFSAGTGCDNGNESEPVNLEEAFVEFDKQEAIKFTISGQAKCEFCLGHEVPIIGMLIEVIPSEDPLHSIGLYRFDGLGPFEIKDISWRPNESVDLLGELYRQGDIDQVPLHGFTKVAVPDEDGKVVSVILQFPSRNTD